MSDVVVMRVTLTGVPDNDLQATLIMRDGKPVLRLDMTDGAIETTDPAICTTVREALLTIVDVYSDGKAATWREVPR